MTKIRHCIVRRMNKLIAALKTEAAKNMFDMRWYITLGGKPPREAFKSGGDCGTSACIAGIAAIIDPRFFRIDGSEFEARKDSSYDMCDDFANWLNIPEHDADLITNPVSRIWYHQNRNDITYAINILEAYRDGGIEKVGELAGVSPPN